MAIPIAFFSTARGVMDHRFCLSLFILCLWCSNLVALSVGYNDSALPFSVTYDQTVQSSFAPVLQVVNEASASVVVLSWQMELEIRPLPGAQGELLFHSVGAPPNSLFGQEPGPISDLMSPSDMLLAFDGDTTDFDGEPVAGQSARNVMELSIVASSDAVGTFQLVMPEFDPGNPDDGSSWFEADGFEPVAFENSSPSDFPGFVLLGSIDVIEAFLPGDYDSDRVVGPLDYQRWRTDFGDPVGAAGDGADGNRDLIVDAADYVIWRDNAVLASGNASAFGAAAPEPLSLVLATMGLISGTLCRWRRYWCQHP